MKKKKQVLIRWKKSSNDYICYRQEITAENSVMYKFNISSKIGEGGRVRLHHPLDNT